MKILVINIALRPNPKLIMLPLGLGYVVSAIKRAGFGFDLLDLDAHPHPPEITEKYLRTHRYDMVAMGCIVTGYKYVKWLSRIIKDAFPDTTIIVGNTVAQSIPDILLTRTDSDVAVMGEGDEVIVQLLQRLSNTTDLQGIKGIRYRKNNKIIQNMPQPLIEDINQIPFPDWDLFDAEVYIQSLSKSIHEPWPPIPPDKIRAMLINTARGCLFKCTFCYHIFRDHKYRWRSPQSIITEMRYYVQHYGANYFAFNDELTFFSVKQAEAFADALIASGLEVWWSADCRSGLFTRDEHLSVIHKLKNAGCLALSFSLESADPEILKWMKKKASVQDFSRQVKLLRQGGIASHTSLVFGYPLETEQTIKATIDVCIANEIYPSAGYLLPQPGSPMYDYAVEHGYIQDEETYLLALGDRQDLRFNMTKLSDEQFIGTVERELARCNQELGMELKDGGLLKTGFYRSKEVQDPPVI